MLRTSRVVSYARKNLCSSVFIIGSLALWIASTAAAQNTAIFNGPLDYLTGGTANSVVIADFNGDGLPDLAVANGGSANVSVLLQNSNGTFQAAVNYAVGNGPEAIQTGDVNGDGKPDLVVINITDNTLSVLLGNGDGTFQTLATPTSLPSGIGSLLATTPLAVGNFNSDNYLDVAVTVPLAQVGTYGIAVLLGNGDGTFQPPVTYALNARPSIVAVADFNNDGKPDIVAATSAGFSVLLGNGDGTFQSPVNTAMTSAPTGLVIADFNQDGNLDIATTITPPMAENYLNLLYGNGNGTFQVQPPLISTVGEGVVPVAAGDLNGDGKPDLIVIFSMTGAPPGGGPVESLLNNGDGTFSVGTTLLGTVTAVAALSDLQGNQKLDLIAPHGVVSVFEGNGDGTFSVFPSYSNGVGEGPVPMLAAADFNGDDKIDLAESGPGLWLNTGAGFSPVTLIKVAPAASGPWVGTGLFDGNSNTDLIVDGSGDGSEAGILVGNGNGTFQPPAYYGTNVTGPIAIGDFNNDGNLDVLGTAYSANAFAVLLGAGNGTFGFPVDTSVSGPISALATANFNKDANLDVAAVVNDSLQVFFGKGDGTFSAGPTLLTGLLQATALVTGDLNGDGNPDVVVAVTASGSSEGSVYVFLGNGDGTFQSPVITTAGCQVVSMTVAYFNGDGKQDVALSNSCWNDVSVLLGNGDGTFQSPVQFAAGGGFLAVADFDGNGSPDLAVSQGSGVVYLLLSGGAQGSAALVSPTNLTFASETVGQTSAAQTIVLTNTNASALSISGIAISGAQSGDYAETNNCGASLASGTTCTIAVTFTAQAAGTRNATVLITDNAINSPQMVSLTGTGTAAPGFTWGMASGGSSSATVSAGKTATFNLTLTPTGAFSGTVNLTCAITPSPKLAPTCSIPSSVSLSGSSPASVTVTVATTAPSTSSSLPLFELRPPASVMGGMLALGAFGLMLLASLRRSRIFAVPAVLAVLLFIWGCGGSSSSTTTTTTIPGTPAGTYTATITSTSGSLTNQTTLTVVVQ